MKLKIAIVAAIAALILFSGCTGTGQGGAPLGGPRGPDFNAPDINGDIIPIPGPEPIPWDSNSHKVCNYMNECITVQGSGISECAIDADCNIMQIHTECDTNRQCVPVIGPGINQCISDLDC